jgi:hypothetical protein
MKLKPFDKGHETWQRFAERVDLYFQAVPIADTDANRPRRRAILLQGMGIELYNKFVDSVGGQVGNLTFQEIVARVEDLVNPPPLEIHERYRFHTRRQQAGESAADYMVALRKIALSCNFGADLDNRLRDQFVFGLANVEIQTYLLRQPQLTVDNVVQLAQACERASQTMTLLSNGVQKVTVNAIRGQQDGRRASSERPKGKGK